MQCRLDCLLSAYLVRTAKILADRLGCVEGGLDVLALAESAQAVAEGVRL